ncbi:hypothetical protein BJ875DRAFT_399589 [Amylocarpus encephaloides]|uniref:Thymidylate kinase n=1 Tax=Amylocarpus encephaloides TaxID=45428 RepID=A0A9P8C614_9HELO|nr:hypothetical protein BJ875DRAFT_399589 [Amylocarpus encephaloides]
MATYMPMAGARQPFAPLNSSRLQNLTSLKNRQNALSSPVKRKAVSFEEDDAENVDPVFLSPKRSKARDGSSKDPSFVKPVNFFLTKAPASPDDFSAIKTAPSTAPAARRPILAAKSQAPRLNTAFAEKTTPLSAPAGRSPTRKRIGILNRRKTASPFTRVDPPKFAAPGAGLGFSIDAALSGTISSRKAAAATPNVPLQDNAHLIPTLHQRVPRDSWFFEIHEDTADELATNLMEHSTCTLDISSDEETEARLRDERGKENVPPLDDISQTRTLLTTTSSSLDIAEDTVTGIKARIRARRSRLVLDENAIEIDRSPLGDLAAEDFYAEGCDGSSVFLIVDEDAESDVEQEEVVPLECEIPHVPTTTTFDFVAEVKGKGREIDASARGLDVESLMQKDDFDLAPKAALLEPLEKADEGFEVWESGSAKDEGEL